MIAQQLKHAFDPYYEAPLEAWTYFASLCKQVHYPKNDVIKRAHEIELHGYFLLEGAVGTFVWKKNSLACLNLFLENSFFADDYSLTTGEPSPLEIVALEPCTVLRLSKENIEKLQQTEMGKLLFMVGEARDNAQKQSHQIDLMTKSPEERYIDLMTQQPEILHRIPQKHIASYLGITTQSLSRIRKRISEGN
ncbi:Crp/Fnr family transcriptional regulator [Pontibacter sp. G13]|uniref:Crp/Fnr family transcriptional regulator n=1 Tax=Pontibacter sp. G13 TaxID=3074898 RepID=UPI00288A1E65|nr:Crp/Fnr family transcriptional regulator [Pontibacter sp. G13]WNJ19163.1 Crp/Fnr family transcriptional regulator [Pontibacter sp. G13]